MPMNLIETIQQARNVSRPLIYVWTWDPGSLIQRLMDSDALKSADHNEDVAVIRWDIADGVQPLGAEHGPGVVALNNNLHRISHQPPAQGQMANLQAKQLLTATRSPFAALTLFEHFPEDSIAFFIVLSPTEFFKDPTVIQKISSLRDTLKANGRMLFLLGPHHELPAALAHDFLVLNDPLPTHAELERIVLSRAEDVKVDNPDMVIPSTEDIALAADSMQSLTTFEAETAIAMSFKYIGDNIGIDYAELREQRYCKIDEIPGLKVWRDSEDFDTLKGVDGAKDELLLYAHNLKKRPGGVIYIDEIDKVFSGGIDGGDNTGTADHFLRALLMLLDEIGDMAFLFLGIPGTGKTAISKALGSYIHRPTIAMNMDEMLSKFLGESQGNQHRAFATARAVTGNSPIIIASCNRDSHLPSSLMRRMATRFFFDLPGRPEKDQMWESKIKIHGLEDQPLPSDERWTGYEINVACKKASLVNRTLIEAARSVIPIASTRWDEVCQMREFAHGKYVCARTGQPYVNGSSSDTEIATQTDRKIVVKKERGH